MITNHKDDVMAGLVPAIRVFLPSRVFDALCADMTTWIDEAIILR
jgi:hypothetical protein